MVCQGSSLIRIRYALRRPALTIWTLFSFLVKTLKGIVILNNDHIYILENPYGVDLNIKITLKDFYKIETDDGKTAIVDDVLNIRIDKDQNFNLYSDVIKIETLKDGSIKYTSLYHESKENSDSLS